MYKKTTRGIKNRLRPLFYPLRLNHDEGKIQIIGCGRSGTTYLSELFKTFGYSIGHEWLERHGIVSWCTVPDTTQRLWGPNSRDLQALKIPVVHQVRHPLDAIPSIATKRERSWQFIEQFIPIETDDSLTLKSMKYWYHWNKLAEPQAELTYRVDDIEMIIPELFRIGGFDPARLDMAVVQSFRKDVNRRDHAGVTLAALQAEDEQLTDQICELATHYGFHFA